MQSEICQRKEKSFMQQYPPEYSQHSQGQYQQYSQPPYSQPYTSVNLNQQGPSFLIRAIWYIFIGWWLGGLCLSLGYLCCISIIFLPIGLMLLNRLPVILTLRPSSQQATVTITNGGVRVNVGYIQQGSFLVRAIYFILIGWWLGLIWAIIGYCLCLTIFLLPFGLLMLNRLPAVLTLYRQ
jgi:uncharacterized membrane protein YccF (DUF307 family)